ncbi:MAG: hypothetical protein IPL79_01540 [Myxococcales bacterium]|nr:hypothetical protein [Myxococcales bacterium]
MKGSPRVSLPSCHEEEPGAGPWPKPWLLAAVALTALGGCRRPAAINSQISNADDRVAAEEPTDDLMQALTAEVLEGYERGNDPFAPELGDYVGIGVGPRELWSAPEDFSMPLAIYGRGYSNRFTAHISTLGSSGWVTDDVSWRVEVCGRVLSIPLRYTAVMRRDGERWYPLMQQVSIATRDVAAADATDEAAAVAAVSGRVPAQAPPPELDGTMALALAGQAGASLDVIGPMAAATARPTAEAATGLVELIQSGRVLAGSAQAGAVAARGAKDEGAVGYWVGVIRVDAAAAQRLFAGQVVAPVSSPTELVGELDLRVAVVLTQQKQQWVAAHLHVSLAIGYERLVRRMFGSQVASLTPLDFVCD